MAISTEQESNVMKQYRILGVGGSGPYGKQTGRLLRVRLSMLFEEYAF
jgi:hypothetical protein